MYRLVGQTMINLIPLQSEGLSDIGHTLQGPGDRRPHRKNRVSALFLMGYMFSQISSDHTLLSMDIMILYLVVNERFEGTDPYV